MWIGRGHRPLDVTVWVEQVRLKVVEACPLAPPYEQSDQECDKGNATDHPANDRTCIDAGRVVVGLQIGNDRRDDLSGGHPLSVGISCEPCGDVRC